jgi:hypothetical protein
MTRAYIRVDPGLYERKVMEDRYPLPAVAALLGCFCMAELQPVRGRFRDRSVLRALLGSGSNWVGFLIEQRDLIVQDNGSLYVDGWDEWIQLFRGEKLPDQGQPDVTEWSSPQTRMPAKPSILPFLDRLEALSVQEILDGLHTTYRKWSAHSLPDHDVLRYFFGTLKRKRESKPVQDSDDCGGACGYTSGRDQGVWKENQRLRELFVNHEANGFPTYADVVAGLWPDD